MSEPLKHNGNLVDSLGSAIRSGEHGLSTVPALLKRVLVEGSWREFVTKRGEVVEHERFADFITTPPLAGLGTTADLVERVVKDDAEALGMFRKAMKHQGSRTDIRDISTDVKSETGTSRSYALSRLERDAPTLHAEVLVGNLSAHAAMVQAGFRPRTFTVRADSPKSVASTLRRRLTPEQIAELVRLLGEES